MVVFVPRQSAGGERGCQGQGEGQHCAAPGCDPLPEREARPPRRALGSRPPGGLGRADTRPGALPRSARSYRYLAVTLGADETIRNDDGLTPLQLAAKLGHRCMQLPVPTDRVSSERPALMADPADPGAWMGLSSAPFVFEFVLKLRQRVLWTYGSVIQVAFPLAEVHGHSAADAQGCLALVCGEDQYDLLCPDGGLEHMGNDPDEKNNCYERPDEDPDDLMRMPIKPGRRAPRVESLVLLILANTMWSLFGRWLLTLEFVAIYLPYLALLTWITIDRATSAQSYTQAHAGADTCLGLWASALLVLTLLKRRPVIDVLQRLYNRLVPEGDRLELVSDESSNTTPGFKKRFESQEALASGDRTRHAARLEADAAQAWTLRGVALGFWTRLLDLLRFLRSVEGGYFVFVFSSCASSLAAVAVRDAARRANSGRLVSANLLARPTSSEAAAQPSLPWDAELLSVASVLAFFNLLSYIRCYNIPAGSGPLAITVVEMLRNDILKLGVIYVISLWAFSLAYHSLLAADGPHCDQWASAAPSCDSSSGIAAQTFNTIPKSLLNGLMMTLGQFQTAAYNSARRPGLMLFLYICNIIVDNLLLLNLLIALLNKTYSDVEARSQQKQIKERTEVVLQLERLMPAAWRRSYYFEALKIERVGEATDGDDDIRHALGASKAGLDMQVLQLACYACGCDKRACKGHVEDEARQPQDGQRVDIGHLLDSQHPLRVQLRDLIFACDGSGPLRCGGAACDHCKASAAAAPEALVADKGKVGELGLSEKDTLLVIDMQMDYMSAHGALPVARARTVISGDGGETVQVPGPECLLPVVNELIRAMDEAGGLVAYTQTCHPAEHRCLYDPQRHPGRAPFDEVDLGHGLQKLWPPHCVEGTPGCRFHPGLLLVETGIVVKKGFRPTIDSFSAFCDADRVSSTGLLEAASAWHSVRHSRGLGAGVGKLYVVGLAYDACIMHSALEAASLAARKDSGAGDMPWGEVWVIEDGTRCIHDDLKSSEATRNMLRDALVNARPCFRDWVFYVRGLANLLGCRQRREWG